MGIPDFTSYIKIRDAILADAEITIDDVKMPSFDPRDLGLTFTDEERQQLKKAFRPYWLCGMKSFIIKEMQAAKDEADFQTLKIALFSTTIPRARALKLIRAKIMQEDD